MIQTLYKPFQYRSETGSVYILSDLYLADADCRLMDSNWIEPEEQIKIIIDMVMKNDTFVCLGDVGDAKYLSEIKTQTLVKKFLDNSSTR